MEVDSVEFATSGAPVMSAHTPGPWEAIHIPAHDYGDVHDSGGYQINADGVVQLAFVWALNHRIPPDGGPQESGPLFGAVQAEANAALIAAAPEMRALAQEALHIALVHKLPQFEQRCRATIAKAGG